MKIIEFDEWWLPLNLGYSPYMKADKLVPRFSKKKYVNPNEIVELKESTFSKEAGNFIKVSLTNGEHFYTVGILQEIISKINSGG